MAASPNGACLTQVSHKGLVSRLLYDKKKKVTKNAIYIIFWIRTKSFCDATISESTVTKLHRLGDKSDKAFVNWHCLWKVAVIVSWIRFVSLLLSSADFQPIKVALSLKKMVALSPRRCWWTVFIVGCDYCLSVVGNQLLSHWSGCQFKFRLLVPLVLVLVLVQVLVQVLVLVLVLVPLVLVLVPVDIRSEARLNLSW